MINPTSYPPQTHFGEEVDEEALDEDDPELERGLVARQPVAVAHPGLPIRGIAEEDYVVRPAQDGRQVKVLLVAVLPRFRLKLQFLNNKREAP